MATASVTVRMDENLKNQAELLFRDMGMNMTTAFTVFAKTAVRQWKMPFELTGDPMYNEMHQKYLQKAIAAMDAGQGKEHELLDDSE
ncbi:MAG: type II toxin-antitoxin system RelB/DinJ family antitoxin [Treponemataceae bacterium]|nr:MAG: type II toxin-antitoxin system RelB/DinJ family antitoxin [Treponemataceae bacterium]